MKRYAICSIHFIILILRAIWNTSSLKQFSISNGYVTFYIIIISKIARLNNWPNIQELSSFGGSLSNERTIISNMVPKVTLVGTAECTNL